MPRILFAPIKQNEYSEMPVTPLRLLVLTRDNFAQFKQGADELVAFLRAQPNVELVEAPSSPDCELSGVNVDFVLVLGGDGTILRACHRLGRNQMPILGVNFGRLGFLADLTPAEFRETFPLLLQRQFRIVDHLMFECELHRQDGSIEVFLGLNEVIVGAAKTLQMIEVRLTIDERPVATYSCDGLIVSTPVGSTAHSLSAGGPMLRKNLMAFVITPICPHTLSNRPLVDDAECVYSLSLTETSNDALLVVDGQHRRQLKSGDVVRVKRAPVTFKLLELPGRNYYATLHRKLGWSGQPLYPTR